MSEPSSVPRSIRTPCVQVCFIDPQSGLCLGCYRNLAEVAEWPRLSDAERARIMAELPGRRGLFGAGKLDPSG